MALRVAGNPLLKKKQKEIWMCLLYDFEYGRKKFMVEDYFRL
jgi:hypothetical protein